MFSTEKRKNWKEIICNLPSIFRFLSILWSKKHFTGFEFFMWKETSLSDAGNIFNEYFCVSTFWKISKTTPFSLEYQREGCKWKRSRFFDERRLGLLWRSKRYEWGPEWKVWVVLHGFSLGLVRKKQLCC